MPANVVGGFSIQLPEETLKPGAETFPCYIFPLAISGPSHIVGGGKLAGQIVHPDFPLLDLVLLLPRRRARVPGPLLGCRHLGQRRLAGRDEATH